MSSAKGTDTTGRPDGRPCLQSQMGDGPSQHHPPGLKGISHSRLRAGRVGR